MNFHAVLDSDFATMIHGEFSEVVEVSNGQEIQTVSVLFEKSYQAVDPESNTIIMSNAPRLILWNADLIFELKQGHTVKARGVTWKVREIQPDGEGSSVVYLGSKV